MEILYLLIPLSIILVLIIAWIFIWSIQSGQYDDLEGPAYQILMDDDRIDDKRLNADADEHHDHGHPADADRANASGEQQYRQ